jgi:hypothetical protein
VSKTEKQVDIPAIPDDSASDGTEEASTQEESAEEAESAKLKVDSNKVTASIKERQELLKRQSTRGIFSN